MSFIKKIIISGLLVTTLYPTFLSAMQNPASPEIQLAFQKALDAQDFEKAEVLLMQGADPNTQYLKVPSQVNLPLGRVKLLGYYAQYGTVEQVTFLLEHGADPLRYEYNGCALHSSVFNTPENAAKIIPLLVKKVGINYQDCLMGRTALHRAAVSGNVVVIKLLLKLGADLNHQDAAGQTPLDEAFRPACEVRSGSYRDYLPAIKILYQYGANTRSLWNFLTKEQVMEFEQAREQRLLARRDCGYLGQPYPYPSDDQLGEDQAPYKDLYNNVLGEYLPLPAPLVAICLDYSRNAEVGALLDPAYADAEAGEQRSNY